MSLNGSIRKPELKKPEPLETWRLRKPGAKISCQLSAGSCQWRCLSLLSFSDCRHWRHQMPPHRHDRALGRISHRAGPRQHFLLDVLHEVVDLDLHLLHALAHLQNDRNAADIYAQG